MNRRHSAALMFLSLLLPAWAKSTTPPKAFDDRAAKAPPAAPERGQRRARAVRVRIKLFNASAALLFQAHPTQSKTAVVAMNFFPGAILRVRWTTAKLDPATGTVEWTGSIEGAPLGSAVLIVNGPRLTGNFGRGDEITYQVRTDANGAVWVREIHQSDFPPEHAPRASFHRFRLPAVSE